MSRLALPDQGHGFASADSSATWSGLRHRWRAPWSSALLQKMYDEVGHELPMRLAHVRRLEVAAKNRAEGMQVGHMKEAKRAHQHVQVDRIEPRAEDPLLAAAPEDLGNRVEHRCIDAANPRRLREMARMMDVLDRHEPHEIG